MAASTSRWAVSLTVAGVWKVWGRVPSLSSQGKFRTFFSHYLLNLMPMGEVSGVRQGLAQLALSILSNVVWGLTLPCQLSRSYYIFNKVSVCFIKETWRGYLDLRVCYLVLRQG